MNQRCTNIAARRALYADEAGKQAKSVGKIYLHEMRGRICIALSQVYIDIALVYLRTIPVTYQVRRNCFLI